MITAFYASLLVVLYIFLTMLVVRKRFKDRISLGDGGDAVMTSYIRAQANFVETVPLALVLLFLAEYNGAHDMVVYGLGALLIIGRYMHPIGIIKNKYNAGKFRFYGMILTLLSIIGAAVINLALSLSVVFS